MRSANPAPPAATPVVPVYDDPVERIAHTAPVVLPLVGAGLIFLLALIAVTMA